MEPPWRRWRMPTLWRPTFDLNELQCMGSWASYDGHPLDVTGSKRSTALLPATSAHAAALGRPCLTCVVTSSVWALGLVVYRTPAVRSRCNTDLTWKMCLVLWAPDRQARSRSLVAAETLHCGCQPQCERLGSKSGSKSTLKVTC